MAIFVLDQQHLIAKALITNPTFVQLRLPGNFIDPKWPEKHRSTQRMVILMIHQDSVNHRFQTLHRMLCHATTRNCSHALTADKTAQFSAESHSLDAISAPVSVRLSSDVAVTGYNAGKRPVVAWPRFRVRDIHAYVQPTADR